jgi:hypothetical protein
MGVVRGGKQVYLCLAKTIPYLLDCARMEPPFSLSRSLAREHVGCLVQNTWRVNGPQGFHHLLTPFEEASGKL